MEAATLSHSTRYSSQTSRTLPCPCTCQATPPTFSLLLDTPPVTPPRWLWTLLFHTRGLWNKENLFRIEKLLRNTIFPALLWQNTIRVKERPVRSSMINSRYCYNVTRQSLYNTWEDSQRNTRRNFAARCTFRGEICQQQYEWHDDPRLLTQTVLHRP